MVVGRRNSDLALDVDGVSVEAGQTLDILGMTFDWRLSTDLYVNKLLAEGRRRISMLRLLRPRIPPEVFPMVASGIFLGKVMVYAGHYHAVRLNESDVSTERSKDVQIMLNDYARLLTGLKRKEHVKVKDLLKQAAVPSLNQLAAREAISQVWDGYVNLDSPLARTVADLRPSRSSRSHTMAKLNLPDPANTLLSSGCKIWNEHSAQLSKISKKSELKTYIKKTVWQSIPI